LKRIRQRRHYSHMDIVKHLVAAADPAGLAIYVAVMAFFLGSVAVARLRDDAVKAHKAKRWRRP
jgi:hypothetical protein